MSALDRADFGFLRANGRLGASSGHYFTHLDQPVGVWNYIRIANSIARQVPTGHILDWGCGYLSSEQFSGRGRFFRIRTGKATFHLARALFRIRMRSSKKLYT